MSVFSFNTNRVEITGLTHDDTFNDVDLSSLVESTTVGVVLEIVNTGTTERIPQLRCNGSTDDISPVSGIHEDFLLF